jgi:NAD(P)-dependent dehydrogenase (short-subunit alcohol dehydrogenase family)
VTRPGGRVWFITGSSSGLGRAVAGAALAAGDRVAATARDPDRLLDLGNGHPGRMLPLRVDVTRSAEIDAAVADTTRLFGRIDVIVNNAGYGLLGALDAVSEEELRAQLETNFFAAVAVTRAAVPVVRRQGWGHFLFVSSLAGQVASPGGGAYAASKFALEGYAEALHEELAPMGIAVTIIEPGPFRTDWSGRSLRLAAKPGWALRTAEIEARIRAAHGHQAGDPDRAAMAILSAMDMKPPPLRLPLGVEAYDRIRDNLHRKLAELDRLKPLVVSTDRFADE